MEFISSNAYSGEILKKFPFHSPSEIEKKVISSEQAYKSWKNFSFQDKINCFNSLAGLLSANLEKAAQLISLEMGKPIVESRAEINKCISLINYLPSQSEALLEDEIIHVSGKNAKISFEPLGIIFGIFPWNFPFWQILRFAVPTLMAGNTVLVKPAPNVPQSSLLLDSLFQEAAFPQGTYNTVFSPIDYLENIVAKKEVKALTLTGSDIAGRSFAVLGAKYLKKSVLELGGSDPFIILNDADLDLAVENAIKSRFTNNGQSCISAKRFIVEQKIYPDFMQAFLTRVQNLKIGPPQNEQSNLTCLARPDLAKKLLSQVQQSIDLGANLFLSPNLNLNSSVSPGILTRIPKNSPAYSEELFGPIASVYIAENQDEAIQIANDTNFGLGSSIWTKDLDKAHYISQNIDAGMVYINEMVRSMPELPFGGINQSGYGRELSFHGITEFVNKKLIY